MILTTKNSDYLLRTWLDKSYRFPYLIDFKNDFTYSYGSGKQPLNPVLKERRHSILLEGHWIPITEEEATKIVIGGFEYAATYYHKYTKKI